ncbi:MAG: glycosyltransferase [Deltaproteobacteria bacterium]|nr:glycosyltransferase [Deltaproteobacteria bacterium]
MNPVRCLSVIVPCYNEEKTLRRSVQRLLAVETSRLSLDIIIVDDCSTDKSPEVARELEQKHENIRFIGLDKNRGKGFALRTGFAKAKGDFVAIHDADLEYDPLDLPRLVAMLEEHGTDVAFGSRYLNRSSRRVLSFWHSWMNRSLTTLSNMFTDLDLTDMETCYKVFRKEALDKLDLKENRFGIEPEMTAAIARAGLTVSEAGISYAGRTWAEGKKINAWDGLRALYCIFHYNAPSLPAPVQFLIYLFIGGVAAVANFAFFAFLLPFVSLATATILAFIGAAAVNYFLSIALLFRHKARWNAFSEILVYGAVVTVVGAIDLLMTKGLVATGATPYGAKLTATAVGLFLNFLGRKYFVF